MQKIGNIPNTRADNNGEFTDGNVAGGVPPTILPAEWFNTIQRELISILSAAGITPDSNKFDQVSKAVSKLITNGGFLKTVNNLSEIKTAGAAAVAATLANLGLPELLDTKFDKTGGTIKAISDAINIQTEWSQSGYLQISGEDGRAIHQIGKIGADNGLTLRNVAENAELTIRSDSAIFNGRKMGYLCEALNSGSGWWRDNDTGLLIQWGTTPAGTDTRWVLFPIPFVNFPHFAVHASPSWYPGAEWGIADRTKLGMNAVTTKSEQGGLYMALGF